MLLRVRVENDIVKHKVVLGGGSPSWMAAGLMAEGRYANLLLRPIWFA